MKTKETKSSFSRKSDEQRYGYAGDYTSFATTPAIMGTLCKSDQKRMKKYHPDKGYNSYKILDRLESM